jgi:hypothetical protein
MLNVRTIGHFVLIPCLFAFSACALESAPEAPDEGSAASEVDTSAEPDSAACGKAGPNLQNHTVADAPNTSGDQQRSGSSTSCAAVGVLEATDSAVYYCYSSDGTHTWTYLLNKRTGVHGWVRDDLLKEDGSSKPCGF